MKLESFLSKAEQRRVVEAIGRAEQRTSGQIKVHVEPRAEDPMARAREVFERLGLQKTKARNAVLIYVASDDRKFAIIGDEGIHAEVGDGFWQDAAAKLTARFSARAFADGLADAIAAIGEALHAKFPHLEGGTNELPDDISTGD